VLALAFGVVDWKELFGGPVSVGGDVATGLEAMLRLARAQFLEAVLVYLMAGAVTWWIASDMRKTKSKSKNEAN
jgi:hypothetical protein